MPKVLRNIKTLYACRPEGEQSDIHPTDSAALVWEAGSILWLGQESELPAEYVSAESHSAEGALVFPGLVDCHTHLAFGGWRADEFERRVLGRSYLEIAKAGGGILSTVKATREASKEELLEKASAQLQKMAALGVTSVECKSGYGLTLNSELKLLEVYKELAARGPQRIASTFLGAHMVPAEFKEKREAYIELLIQEMLPAVSDGKLAQFCDVFVEDSAFTIDEARRVLEAGKEHGLRPKLHVDQLSAGGGAELAAELSAASADHLEFISEQGRKDLAEKDVVAVTLPLASLYTRQPYMNGRKLIEAGAQVAVATDFNPGSAPSSHLPLAMMLSCNGSGLTPQEALKGVTIIASKAMGIEAEAGSLEVGKSADFCLIQAPSVNHWLYNFEANACRATVCKGETIFGELGAA